MPIFAAGNLSRPLNRPKTLFVSRVCLWVYLGSPPLREWKLGFVSEHAGIPTSLREHAAAGLQPVDMHHPRRRPAFVIEHLCIKPFAMRGTDHHQWFIEPHPIQQVCTCEQ